MPKTIYLWGDTPLLLLGLEGVLSKVGFSVKRRCLRKDHPANERGITAVSFIVLELSQETNQQQSYVQRFLKHFPSARILLLHRETDHKRIRSFFKAGIRAYGLPSMLPEHLEQALRYLEQNQAFIDPQLNQQWTQHVIGSQPVKLKLTRREKEVLQLIVEEYTTKEIAEKLFISQCTAETHRLNIIHKLGVRNTAGVVREALRLGWCA